MEERARHPPRAKLGTHSVSALAPSAQRGKRGPRESAIWGCTVRQLQCQAHPQASPSLRPMQAAELTHGDQATHHHRRRRLRGPSNCRRGSRGSSACSCSHEPGASWGNTPASVHRPGQDPKPGLCGPGAWPGLGMGRRAAQDRGGMARVVPATRGSPGARGLPEGVPQRVQEQRGRGARTAGRGSGIAHLLSSTPPPPGGPTPGSSWEAQAEVL